MAKKRKLSPYNKFVKSFFRKNTGATMKQAAAAWNRKKRGSPSKTRRTAPRTTARTVTKRRRTTARKKKRRSSPSFSQAKMFGLIRKIALIAPAVGIVVGGGSGQDKVARGIEQYTGYNTNTQAFNSATLKNGWSAFLAATVITAGIPKINKLLKGLI